MDRWMNGNVASRGCKPTKVVAYGFEMASRVVETLSTDVNEEETKSDAVLELMFLGVRIGGEKIGV